MTDFSLTKREQQVLELLADGLTLPAIADRLGTSLGTVKRHVSSVQDKLGATNGRHTVSLAYRAGLLKVEVRP